MVNQDKIHYETVGRGYHSGAISSMDVAVQRPILVTFSKDDSTIRFWNYLTGLCMLARRYTIQASSTTQTEPSY